MLLRIPYHLAPIQVAVLPLSRKDSLMQRSREITRELSGRWRVQYDDTGSIGKRYRRQDEVGTPFCVTCDFDSETDHKVTVRDRDSMGQDRIAIDQVDCYLQERFKKPL
ncbi:MAG: hypothetical protein HYW02_01595 [Deltaproteobacteria bacterium]|nr:hypothetical protein [Deltaproteobacteria bacterium]